MPKVMSLENVNLDFTDSLMRWPLQTTAV